MSNQIDFEFGETNAAQAFWSRNATFWPAFGRLIALTNKCFFEQLKERHDKVKDQFQVTRCKKCGARDLAISWDLDMTSMVNKIEEPYKTLFLSCYTLPTLQGHATLASAFSSDAREQVDDRRIHDAESSLIFATLVFITVLQSQDKTFALGFDQQIADCWEEVSTVWKDRPHGPLTPTP